LHIAVFIVLIIRRFFSAVPPLWPVLASVHSARTAPPVNEQTALFGRRRPPVQFMTGGLFRPCGVLRKKGPAARVFKHRRKNMRLMVNYELLKRNEKELSALFGQISKGLAMTGSGTPERRNALASLENISQVRAQKLAMRPG
jgi:hypothetical protein